MKGLPCDFSTAFQQLGYLAQSGAQHTMRVELFGNKPLVSSVEVSLSAAGLHVLVNLTKRGAPAHCQGSSSQFRARPEEEFLPHDTPVFSDPDVADDEAEEASNRQNWIRI